MSTKGESYFFLVGTSSPPCGLWNCELAHPATASASRACGFAASCCSLQNCSLSSESCTADLPCTVGSPLQPHAPTENKNKSTVVLKVT